MAAVIESTVLVPWPSVMGAPDKGAPGIGAEEGVVSVLSLFVCEDEGPIPGPIWSRVGRLLIILVCLLTLWGCSGFCSIALFFDEAFPAKIIFSSQYSDVFFVYPRRVV